MNYQSSVILIFSVLLATSATSAEWFDGGNFYQVYPRSFKDSDGDGVGDLQGIKSKLPYLKGLGMDGVWLSPIYKSPMVDFGYDISNFCEIHEEYGTMKDFNELVDACKNHGLRLVLDFVPNHSSSEHEWFIKSENREPGFENFYIWHPGKFDEVSKKMLPPNNWISAFRYSSWTWSPIRKEFYYHKYHKKQPDLNYRNPQVVEEMNNVLLFWLHKGVSGFRIDAISNLFEKQNPDGSFPDEPQSKNKNCDENDHCFLKHIYTRYQDETYEMVYKWRQLVDDFAASYALDPIVLMTESFEPIDLNMRYYGNGSVDGSHVPFNFELIKVVNVNSTAEDYKTIVEQWLDKMPTSYQANWVLGNHDFKRLATRLGVQRGDLINIMLQTLPGIAITYQGEEILMEDVDVSWEQTVDPKGKNASPETYKKYSRDSSRTPFAWDDSKNAGFSTGDTTWLPVGEKYKITNVKAQEEAKNSHLKIFKHLTRLRKHPVLKKGSYSSALSNENNVYLYTRQHNDQIAVITLNFGSYEESVKLTDLFPSIPQQLKVYTSSLDSGFNQGDMLETSAVTVKGNSGLVLVSPNINISDNDVCTTPKSIKYYFMK